MNRDLTRLSIMAALSTMLPPRAETMVRTPVPKKQHDPERLAAAEAKRARKAAKRLAVLH